MNHTISCTYVGHSTCFLKVGNCNLITDPHFSKRTLLLKRAKPLAIQPETLPDMDAILLSHMHFDHFNIRSYKYLSVRTPIIIPEGCASLISQYLPNPIVELSHFSNYKMPDGIEITAIPVSHFSFRILPFRYRKSNAYLIKDTNSNSTVFFCGDSAYTEDFTQIGDAEDIDLALLPVGGYAPRFLMKFNHMTPAEAVQSFEDLRAKFFIPIHHGTFRLSLESLGEPVKWLEKIMSEREDFKEKIKILDQGKTFDIPSKK